MTTAADILLYDTTLRDGMQREGLSVSVEEKVRIALRIADLGVRFFVVDGYAVAKEAGLGTRVNTVLQTCFFALAGVMPVDEAIEAIKDAIVKTYGRRGETVLTRNFAAVDAALAAMHEVAVPSEAAAGDGPAMLPPVPVMRFGTE